MKKYTIPSVLASIVVIAAIFAFMPVEQATTVHTTILSSQTNTATFVDTNWDDTAETPGQDQKRLQCDAAALITEIAFDVEALTEGGDDINLIIDVDGAGLDHDPVTQVDIFAGNTPADESNMLSTRGLQNGVALEANGNVSFTLTAEATDGNDEIIQLTAFYSSGGTCTWTDQ